MPASIAPDEIAGLMIPSGTPAWLGVSRDEREYSSFYAVTIELFEPNTMLDGECFLLKFSSDDNIDNILKIVRTNEVWGKPVNFTIIRPMDNLFDEFIVIRLREASITQVSKVDNIHSWSMACRRAVVQK